MFCVYKYYDNSGEPFVSEKDLSQSFKAIAIFESKADALEWCEVYKKRPDVRTEIKNYMAGNKSRDIFPERPAVVEDTTEKEQKIYLMDNDRTSGLTEYLKAGWKITNMSAFAYGESSIYNSGCYILLERPKQQS